MKILHLAHSRGTNIHRIRALERLGHEVFVLDPGQFLPKNVLLKKINWETGYRLTEKRVTAGVLQKLAELGEPRYDLAWVDSGHEVGPSLVREIQRRGMPVVNYVVDDPYGNRDRFLWSLYLKTVPEYDLLVVARPENIEEARARGAKKVIRVYRSADELAHKPRVLTAEDHARWDSEVAFIGTWFPERGPFMVELLRRGVPLSLYGNRWNRAKEWPFLRKAWKGPGTTNDDDYAKAIQCSKISLGLLSKGNRDLHTKRSIEVPILGTAFCAERTSEHLGMYCDGEEAVFWDDAAECADACLALLADDGRRQEIARRGQLRARQNGLLNEPAMAGILREVPTR